MSEDRLNLVIFGVDSLRADHMSCYGYPRLTTPHIDRMANDGVLFENAYSPYIPTTPGYTTMLTGMDVMSHEMVSLRPKGPIDPNIRLLSEILHDKGYVSASVGLDNFYRGFDKYESYESWMAWEDAPGHKAEYLNDKALPLLEEMAQKQPFFLFMRHMDPHSPYLPPPPFPRMFYEGNWRDPSMHSMEPVFAFDRFAEFFRSWMPPGVTDIEYIVALYDASLAYMDACIQHVLTRLEELDLMDNALIVLTADHGETLTEHECYFDHHGLYECTIHIPLIYRCPGKLPRSERITGFTLQQDLTPTVLELLGYGEIPKQVRLELLGYGDLPKGLRMSGKSAIPLIRGEVATNYSEFYITECTWMRKRGWRTAEWKLIEALEPDFHDKPPIELYNLLEDPEENRNLAKKEPEIVETLRKRMAGWVEKRMNETGKPDPILGYQLGLDLRIGSIKAARELQAVGEEEKAKKSAEPAGGEEKSEEYMHGRAYARGGY
jgi:arylsulfatase A-like enzyme